MRDQGSGAQPARLPARAFAALVALLAVLYGCIPMIPVPSKQGPDPYPSEKLEFLTTGITTREEVTARLGAPPISRAGGSILVYGAARDAGGGRLVFLPLYIPISVGESEFFVLFVEFGPDGTVAHHELVPSGSEAADRPGRLCSVTGICLLRSEWGTAGVPMVWQHPDKIRRGDRALLTAPTAIEAHALRMEAPVSGCQVYFWTRYPKLTWRDKLFSRSWGNVYFGMDDEPRVLHRDLYETFRVFSMWSLPAGQHTLRATQKDGSEVASYQIDCRDGGITAIEGVVVPTVLRVDPEAKLVPQDLEYARQSIEGRRLLLGVN